jgi:hypothetical protein
VACGEGSARGCAEGDHREEVLRGGAVGGEEEKAGWEGGVGG